jgi:L-fuconolactonase
MIKIDAHQHFWNLTEAAYPWLGPRFGPIFRNFEPDELAPQLQANDIDRTIVVQAANSYEDTAYMLKLSDMNPWIGAVTGWVNLLDPAETEQRLKMYTQHSKFRAVRHLIHDEPDPNWVLQPVVAESLEVVAQYKVIFEVPDAYPRHLKQVPTLCERVPALTFVVDHLAKPPIKQKTMHEWDEQFKKAASYPNVFTKVSGLNTAADWENWSGRDLKPYIDFAFDCFGAERMMYGSDWPVCMLAGDYRMVCRETAQAMSHRKISEIEQVFGKTAQELYRIV